MTEIKPCPICKGEIRLSESPMFGYTYYQFWCTECNMGFSKIEWQLGKYTKSQIIEEWNKRAKE